MGFLGSGSMGLFSPSFLNTHNRAVRIDEIEIVRLSDLIESGRATPRDIAEHDKLETLYRIRFPCKDCGETITKYRNSVDFHKGDYLGESCKGNHIFVYSPDYVYHDPV